MKSNLHAPHLTISVTKEIVDNSVLADSSHCMIAEAIRHSFPNAERISVDLQTIRFSDKEKDVRYIYLTPRIAQMSLVRFDMGDKPAAFSFQLRAGQVTVKSPTRHPAPKKPISEAKRASLEKARSVLPAGRTRLEADPRSHKAIPVRVGGKAPPMQKIAGEVPFSRRRQFGLRGLDRAPKVDIIE